VRCEALAWLRYDIPQKGDLFFSEMMLPANSKRCGAGWGSRRSSLRKSRQTQPVSSSCRETRLQCQPRHLRRGDLDGPDGNRCASESTAHAAERMGRETAERPSQGDEASL